MTIRSGTFRVAVGGVAHETNTYATEYLGVTELAAFHQYCGEEIERAFSGTNHPLGGFIAGAAKHQLDLAYTFFGQATPSGIIKSGAYAEMKNRVLEGVRQAMPLDAVLLALHGAAVAEGTEDVEGDLATAVREIVGPDVPIAAVYDLHGNMTERMKTACTLTLPCKLYPHTDLGERGEEAVRLLMRILCGESRPFTYMCQLPMLPYIVATEANFAPVAVNELCRTISGHPGVIDCSWFHGFPYADVAAPCPTVICTTESDPELAKSCAVKVAEWIWTHREDFKPRSLTPAQGVAEAMAENGGLSIINEYADNPGGGAPGDGTFLLRALIDAKPAPGSCCFASINDAQTVRQAVAAGVGSTIRIRLGGKLGKFQGHPIEAEAYVKTITDGIYFNRKGSMLEGVRFDLGTMCRLVIQGIDVIVASRAEQMFDPEPIHLHGIDVASCKIVAIKSANHFRAGFRHLATRIITVDSPGLSSADITAFPRTRLSAVVWPIVGHVNWTVSDAP